MRNLRSLRHCSRHLLLPKLAEPVSLPFPLCSFRAFEAPGQLKGTGCRSYAHLLAQAELSLCEKGLPPAGAGGVLGPATGQALAFGYS